MITKDSVDVSLSEIADKVGFSAALVQYHFGSKEGLLLALVERDAAKAVEQLRELDATPVSVEKKLRMHIAGLINAYFRAPYINSLLHTLMRNSSSDSARHVSQIFVKPIADFQRKLLEQGEREGVFRPVDARDFYFMVIGACDHLFARRSALMHVFGLKEITDDVKQAYSRSLASLVMNGIAAESNLDKQ